MEKIKIYILIIVFVTLSLGIVAMGFGEDEKSATKAANVEAKAEKKEMTKDEVLAKLKNDLSKNREVFNMLPDLNAEKDKDGNVSYTFRGVRLDDLAKEDLDNLSKRVRRILVRIRTDRIQHQLDSIRQAQRLQNVTVPYPPPSVPVNPPSPPRAPAPPPPPAPSSRK